MADWLQVVKVLSSSFIRMWKTVCPLFKGIDTRSGEATLFKMFLVFFFSLNSEIGSTLRGKNLLPRGANSFRLE